MPNRYSLKQYRAIDLGLFALICCVGETLIVTASSRWYADQLYTVSLAGAVTAIVLLRWGPWAAIHAALSGLVFSLASHGSVRQVLIYSAGNLLSLAMLFPLRRLGGERIRQSAGLTVLFGIVTLLLMQLGRGLAALLLGSPPQALPGFITSDSLSFLFTGVLLWIARRLDGMLEDQKHYLLRIHAPEEEKGGF